MRFLARGFHWVCACVARAWGRAYEGSCGCAFTHAPPELLVSFWEEEGRRNLVRGSKAVRATARIVAEL